MNELYGFAIFIGIPAAAGGLAAWKALLEHRKSARGVEAEPSFPWVIAAFLLLSPVAVQLILPCRLGNAGIVTGLFIPILGVLLLPAGLYATFTEGPKGKRLPVAALLLLAWMVNGLMLVALL